MRSNRIAAAVLGVRGLALGLLALMVGSAAADQAAEIAAGESHSCALTAGGGIQCWGDNYYGQLGDGSTTSSSEPVAVVGLSSGVAAFATGYGHSCALTMAGGVQCWGYNLNGQLGDGTTTYSSVPVSVSGLSSGVAWIAAGWRHTCAVTTGGGVQCWGDNDEGELGNGTNTDSSVPVGVSGLSSGVVAVDTGRHHTCAVTTGGGVQCWGYAAYGRLGDGSGTDSNVPVAVTGLSSGVAAIALGGSHSCALTTEGGVWCWGYNGAGQLGDGTTAVLRAVPVPVSGLSSGVALISAYNHTCAVTTGGRLKCWGYNVYGQLGDGTTTDRTAPVAVPGLPRGVVGIATGSTHTCALWKRGGVQCWGNNDDGQLGDGRTTYRTLPVGVADLSSSAAAVATGVEHTCALTLAGGVQCWGYNGSGQLGDGTTMQRGVPVGVVGLSSGVASVAAAEYHSCALMNWGGVRCWGNNTYGQLGDGNNPTRSLVPVDVSGLSTGAVAIAAGLHHACVITTSGGVQCWGRNYSGELGDGTTTHRSVPVGVTGLSSGVDSIAVGGKHTCALSTAGGVQCWGGNDYGQLGDGTVYLKTAPVAVSGLSSGVAAIAAGGEHTCALLSGGGVQCWGRNGAGQLGDGSTSNRNTPVAVSGLSSGVVAIAAGGHHTCALTIGNEIWCWGANGSGQFGDGSQTGSNIPVMSSGLLGGVAALATGGYYTCAVTTEEGVQCWGSNSAGQLGDGSVVMSFVPRTVVGFEQGPWVPVSIPALSLPGLALLVSLLLVAGMAQMKR